MSFNISIGKYYHYSYTTHLYNPFFQTYIYVKSLALEIATILPEFKTTSALKLVFLTPQKDLLNDEGLPTRLDTNATQKHRHFFLSDSASIPTEDCNLKHASRYVIHTAKNYFSLPCLHLTLLWDVIQTLYLHLSFTSHFSLNSVFSQNLIIKSDASMGDWMGSCL